MWNKNGWFHITIATVPLFYQARLVAAGLRKEVRVCPSPLSPSLKNLKLSSIFVNFQRLLQRLLQRECQPQELLQKYQIVLEIDQN